ncbi:MAG: 4Fe-4S binding protein [Vicinamibacteria bacterium]|nr:4Fe-4S binding protein [Vicinamibacteria bacterium]
MAGPTHTVQSQGRNTRRRRLIQAGFLAGFAILPIFDLLRFDFTASKLYLFRQEIGLDEWALLWLALMFGMWLIGAASLVLGRVFCAYACPQTLFTELAHDLDRLASRLARPLDPERRKPAARAVAMALVFALSVVATALLMAYFAPLPDVIARIARFDVGLWVGAVGVTLTLLTFLDLAFVRESFCRTACPYGLLQGVIEDGRSLHVRFSEQTGKCIDCGLCERVCPMAIDIRQGSFQIECTRCGSCIDACDGVLGRLKQPRPGLLAFDMGGLARGGWDVKRVLVSVATIGFGAALVVGIALRQPVALHLSPVFAGTETAEPGFAEARSLLRAANRTKAPLTVSVAAEGLPAGAVLSGLEDGVVPPGQERRFTIVVKVPADAVSGITPFAWVVDAPPVHQRFPASLLSRSKRSS